MRPLMLYKITLKRMNVMLTYKYKNNGKCYCRVCEKERQPMMMQHKGELFLPEIDTGLTMKLKSLSVIALVEKSSLTTNLRFLKQQTEL